MIKPSKREVYEAHERLKESSREIALREAARYANSLDIKPLVIQKDWSIFDIFANN